MNTDCIFILVCTFYFNEKSDFWLNWSEMGRARTGWRNFSEVWRLVFNLKKLAERKDEIKPTAKH